MEDHEEVVVPAALLLPSDRLLYPPVMRMVKAGVFEQPVSRSSLAQIGEALELTTHQRVENNVHVYNIANKIQECLAVSYFYVSGSYGRRVAIGTPEIDLIVFFRVNQCTPKHIVEEPDVLLPQLHRHLQTSLASNANCELFPVSQSWTWPGTEGVQTRQRFVQNCPPHLPVRIASARFRIFLAPALANTAEEQRQEAYKLLKRVHKERGPQAAVSLYPALLERPSEDVANESVQVQGFVRLCQYWVQLQQVPSLSKYAVEILALFAARTSLQNHQQDGAPSYRRSVGSSGPSTTVLYPTGNSDGPATVQNRKRHCNARDPIVLSPEPRRRLEEKRSEASSPNEVVAGDDLDGDEDFDAVHAFGLFLQFCQNPKAVLPQLVSVMEPLSDFADQDDSGKDSNLDNGFHPYYSLLEGITPEDAAHLAKRASIAYRLLHVPKGSRGTLADEQVVVHDVFSPERLDDVARTGKFFGRTGSAVAAALLSCLTMFTVLLGLLAVYLAVAMDRHQWKWQSLQKHFWNDAMRDRDFVLETVNRLKRGCEMLLHQWTTTARQMLHEWRAQHFLTPST